MTNNFRGFMNVDELIERTSLDAVLGRYGLPLASASATGEYRMKCVFDESCSDSTYGNLCVSLDTVKRIYCHTCGVRGNLLTLLFGLEYKRAPEGGRLRGQEFKDAVALLREINGIAANNVVATDRQPAAGKPARTPESGTAESPPPGEALSPTAPLQVNVPLKRHEKEAARALENLYQELVTDVAQMSPEASAYVRKRPWLTPELMQKWGCGWIPGNGRSLFRKNYFVYTHRNQRGNVVSYSGRDLSFEKKWDQWLRDGKPEGKKPNKHRYVAGYHRGVELFGAIGLRLEEPAIQESLKEIGLVVVEGMNDVMRLDELGVCAVGLGSNRATDTQVGLITKFAHQVADGRVLLFPDRDEEGTAGFKELLWQLAQTELQVRVISPEIAAGAGKQPEDATADEIEQLKG